MDLWHTLTQTDRPILLYGMGNGADKIISVLHEKGVSISGVFASDGFVRGQCFHQMTVMGATKALTRYPDAIVLLAFGSAREDVLAAIDRVRLTHTLLVPDVPVFGNNLFDNNFYQEHKEHFLQARSLLADERSRRLFDDIVAFKLSGNPTYLWDTQPQTETIRECLHPDTYRHCLDLGAYVGDTAEQMLSQFPNLKTVHAWEPDPKTYVKLCRFATCDPRVIPCNLASLDYTGEVLFSVSGNRNAGIDAPGKTAAVPCSAVDDMVGDSACDFIKIDVEGAERRTLSGCAQTLRSQKPDLLISLYHRSEDLFDLPLHLHQLNPDYKMYLRRDKGLPAWDIVLAATCQ